MGSRLRYTSSTMWCRRLLQLINRSDTHLLLQGGERYGVDFLFDALSKEKKTAWVDLQGPDIADIVAQGNALAKAVNQSLGSAFLPLALPYSYHLEMLRGHPEILEGLFITVTNASTAPQLCEALLTLPATSCRVVIDWKGPVELKAPQLQTVPPQQLALTPDEARELAGKLSLEALRNLWQISGGAYLDFLTGLNRLTGKDLPEVPTPSGATKRPLGEEILVDPDVFLDVLVLKRRYIEALDVACRNVPHRVKEIVNEAGAAYQDQGLYERLFLNLRSLDEEFLNDEHTLEWLFVAAVYIGRTSSILPLIEEFLEHHDAYHLRTRYVGMARGSADPSKEAERLAKVMPTPLSLFQWGRLHPDTNEGIAILKRAVRLAEEQGRPYDAVRNAGALAGQLLYASKYSEALSWSEWALRRFDVYSLADGQRRLSLLNDWAFGRLVTGQLAGLREELWEHQASLENAMPDLALAYRSTLAELELLQRNYQEAESLARTNVWQSSRHLLDQYIITLVRILLEQDKAKEALKEAQLAYDLLRDEPFSHGARLALGMALSVTDPAKALEHLRTVMLTVTEPAERRCAAALYYLVVTDEPFDSLPKEIKELFRDVKRSGLLVFSGPEQRFVLLWGQILADEAPLRIEVLGRPRVYLNGERLELPPAVLELLVVLALNPEGVSLEQLHLLTYPDQDESKMANLKTGVSRLRKFVPIDSTPYRINVGYSLDILELERLVAKDRLREALWLFEGELLPKSAFQTIEERRAYLEELVRQAVLNSLDPEVLFAYASKRDDLEAWEAAVIALEGARDPRVAVAKAHLERSKVAYGLS